MDLSQKNPDYEGGDYPSVTVLILLDRIDHPTRSLRGTKKLRLLGEETDLWTPLSPGKHTFKVCRSETDFFIEVEGPGL